MKGTVPGRMMLEKIFSLEAEKLRATRMKRASLVLTPDWVLMRIGMTAPRKTTTTFDQMPMPNQMMMSGNSVTRGTALSVSTNGLIILQTLGQTDRQSERDRQRQRRAVAQDEFACADLNVVPEIAIVAQLPARLRDLRGEGDEQRIDETATAERLPNQQHGNERAAAERPKHDTIDGIIDWLAGPAQHIPS